MSTMHHSHAAMLQLIAEGLRSPVAGGLDQPQRERVAGLLDKIAVDLLLPDRDAIVDPSLLSREAGGARPPLCN